MRFVLNDQVIYGDTDSVMVQFGTPDVDEAMKLGREAAQQISDTFTKVLLVTFCIVFFENTLGFTFLSEISSRAEILVFQLFCIRELY